MTMEMLMTVRKRAGGRWRKPGAVCVCAVAVDAEERRHLVEACAFFRADHFREADPGHLRAQDRKDAAVAIDVALRRRKRPSRGAKPPRQGAGRE